MLAHQIGWSDDKGVDVCPWGLKIKLHKLHNVVNDGMLIICILHN
jgi:hypothetical protein